MAKATVWFNASGYGSETRKFKSVAVAGFARLCGQPPAHAPERAAAPVCPPTAYRP